MNETQTPSPDYQRGRADALREAAELLEKRSIELARFGARDLAAGAAADSCAIRSLIPPQEK